MDVLIQSGWFAQFVIHLVTGRSLPPSLPPSLPLSLVLEILETLAQ
jgi:hypothetical protein